MVSISIKDILKGNREANPLIFYGDLITVKKSTPIYVVGLVGKPGQVPISDGLTVRRVIDASGGLAAESDGLLIRLYRTNNQKTEVIEFAPDDSSEVSIDEFLVREYDIVEVFGKGNQRSKFPPVLRLDKDPVQNLEQLPVRVIK
jgi:protein involved in polysaccharide export with SLBB domain